MTYKFHLSASVDVRISLELLGSLNRVNMLASFFLVSGVGGD